MTLPCSGPADSAICYCLRYCIIYFICLWSASGSRENLDQKFLYPGPRGLWYHSQWVGIPFIFERIVYRVCTCSLS